MLLDKEHFSASHFELKWPKDVFKDELDRLLRDSSQQPRSRMSLSDSEWHEECELLLEEAFRYEEPKQEFGRCVLTTAFGENDTPSQVEWLLSIQRYAQYLPLGQQRRPYWSQQRSRTSADRKLSLREVSRQIRDLIAEFEAKGYLAQAFGQYCIDSGDEVGMLGSEPTVELHRQLGRDDLWPIGRYWEGYDLNDLCDVTEFVHDHLSRPMGRYYHSYGNCGTHYSRFRRELAQKLYRRQVNEILGDSEFNLTFNRDGRFEEVTADALEPLISGARSDLSSGGTQHDELQHAIDQFRRRGATETEKRQAIVTLAGVLEERKAAVKEYLLSKDEDVLFHIANRFNLRHRKADQLTGYDTELYFQWIFYWYVSTIRLTDRILERQRHAEDSEV